MFSLFFSFFLPSFFFLVGGWLAGVLSRRKRKLEEVYEEWLFFLCVCVCVSGMVVVDVDSLSFYFTAQVLLTKLIFHSSSASCITSPSLNNGLPLLSQWVTELCRFQPSFHLFTSCLVSLYGVFFFVFINQSPFFFICSLILVDHFLSLRGINNTDPSIAFVHLFSHELITFHPSHP